MQSELYTIQNSIRSAGRPLDGGNTDGKFCLVNENDYIKQANEERFVIVQIEDPEPLAELDEICALPGIDMIFFGPADFSQGIGKPNQFDAPGNCRNPPPYRKNCEKIRQVCRNGRRSRQFRRACQNGVYLYLYRRRCFVALWQYFNEMNARFAGRDIAEVE